MDYIGSIYKHHFRDAKLLYILLFANGKYKHIKLYNNEINVYKVKNIYRYTKSLL